MRSKGDNAQIYLWPAISTFLRYQGDCDPREPEVDQMKKREGITEQLKAEQPMIWVGRMNNIRSRAEEIVRVLSFQTVLIQQEIDNIDPEDSFLICPAFSVRF